MTHNVPPFEKATAIDLASAQIKELGFTLIGSANRLAPGHIIKNLTTLYREKGQSDGPLRHTELQKHEFRVIAPASDRELEQAEEVVVRVFKVPNVIVLPPGCFWFRCVTAAESPDILGKGKGPLEGFDISEGQHIRLASTIATWRKDRVFYVSEVHTWGLVCWTWADAATDAAGVHRTVGRMGPSPTVTTRAMWEEIGGIV